MFMTVRVVQSLLNTDKGRMGSGELKKGGQVQEETESFPELQSRDLWLHNTQATQNKHASHTCSAPTHLEVNTRNTHIAPTGVRDTDPFLSAHQCWYTVVLGGTWSRDHRTWEKLPSGCNFNTLYPGHPFPPPQPLCVQWLISMW